MSFITIFRKHAMRNMRHELYFYGIHVILAYRTKISLNYTGASKFYLTHPYPSRGKDKNREFSRV